MTRHLHSFTLTPLAHETIMKIPKGGRKKGISRSGEVSNAIVKYANDYHLSPTGVAYWRGLVKEREENIAALQRIITKVHQERDEALNRQSWGWKRLLRIPQRRPKDQ